ncbi:hypothetical protein [Nannocystis bainbridge]|uniref:Uncharacterized protein n=1 Tax=Nannocystis bainbridge TaxID=2995303 RepID=A0ABT5E716_9BACT|nr:hypothetical protein [Nannocystis bainbridge]MDC0721660.1 hypothetical protein [Nannocystis bainbridge]
MEPRGLVFSFKDLIDECMVLKAFAKPFLDKTTLETLDLARYNLESIQASGVWNQSSKWQIPANRPLCTVPSEGESQPDKKSKFLLRGKFSFVWEIRAEKPKKGPRSHTFSLEGLASTVIDIMEQTSDGERCIAHWTVDVGDHSSPGTHFHFQMNGFEKPPFPKALDIPRLPAPLMSPFLAIDLALGELFQDRWALHATSESPDIRRWRNLHGERLLRFFKWQSGCVERAAGSPWIALKKAKPPRDLLVCKL